MFYFCSVKSYNLLMPKLFFFSSHSPFNYFGSVVSLSAHICNGPNSVENRKKLHSLVRKARRWEVL